MTVPDSMEKWRGLSVLLLKQDLEALLDLQRDLSGFLDSEQQIAETMVAEAITHIRRARSGAIHGRDSYYVVAFMQKVGVPKSIGEVNRESQGDGLMATAKIMKNLHRLGLLEMHLDNCDDRNSPRFSFTEAALELLKE